MIKFTVRTVGKKEYQIFKQEDLTLSDLGEILVTTNCVEPNCETLDMIGKIDDRIKRKLFEHKIVITGLNEDLLADEEKRYKEEKLEKVEVKFEPGDILKCVNEGRHLVYLMIVVSIDSDKTRHMIIDMATGLCVHPNTNGKSLTHIIKIATMGFKDVYLMKGGELELTLDCKRVYKVEE